MSKDFIEDKDNADSAKLFGIGLDGVVIKDKEMLVTPILDYFAARKEGFDSHIREYDEFEVGIIEKTGSMVNNIWEDHIIYFQKNLCMSVNVKGIGKYMVVPVEYMILVRMDQDRDDYNK